MIIRNAAVFVRHSCAAVHLFACIAVFRKKGFAGIMMKKNDNLRKLRKAELLQIMLEQSDEIDRLRDRVEELEKELMDRRITIEEAGSIAEASLKLTRVFEEAQKAADLYLENIRGHRSPDSMGMRKKESGNFKGQTARRRDDASQFDSMETDPKNFEENE